MWCAAYQTDFAKRVTTNNGVERLNRMLKEEVLSHRTNRANMVKVFRALITKMFPLLNERYTFFLHFICKVKMGGSSLVSWDVILQTDGTQLYDLGVFIASVLRQ